MPRLVGVDKWSGTISGLQELGCDAPPVKQRDGFSSFFGVNKLSNCSFNVPLFQRCSPF